MEDIVSPESELCFIFVIVALCVILYGYHTGHDVSRHDCAQEII